jgi:hypothetical protein
MDFYPMGYVKKLLGGGKSVTELQGKLSYIKLGMLK